MASESKTVPSARQRLFGHLRRLLGGRRAALADAEARLAARKWRSAERAFEAMLGRWPDDPDALYGIARVAYRRARFADALGCLDRAASLRPRDPAIQLLRGRTALLAGDHGAALAAFAAAQAAGDRREVRELIAAVEGERSNTAPPDRATVFVSFATPAFAAAQARLRTSAVTAGRIGRSIEWNSAQLRDTPFHAAHRAVLDSPRGAGYWAWKPYIVLAAFDAVPEGGYVVYCDCGRGDGYLFRQSVAPLIRWCEATGSGALPGVHVPGHGRNAAWTKRDCFVRMGCDGEAFWNAPQVQATFSVWRRDARNRAFLERWLAFCTDRAIVSDDANVCGLENLPDFREHRHDQSVLTNLCLAEGLAAFGPPDEKTQRSKDVNATISRIRAAGF
jgi:hypothetical protein